MKVFNHTVVAAAVLLRICGHAGIAAASPLPPVTQPPKGVIRLMKPKVRVCAGEKVELENSYLLMELGTRPLVLRRLLHKLTGDECLVNGQTSNLFAVAVDDKLVVSDTFEVTSMRSYNKKKGTALTVKLRSGKVSAQFTVWIDNSCEIRFGLKLTNTDAQTHRLRVFFPLLNHLTVGDLKGTYYFYPFKGGWTSNVPFHLGHGYGTPTGSLQVMSIFNPLQGGGVYMWVSDSTGAMKTLWLRKVEQKGVMPMAYESLQEEMRAKEVPFDLSPGISMTFSPLVRIIASNQTIIMPEAVIGLHEGDWREALNRYTGWVRTWWKPPNPKVPVWFRRYFNICALHDHESIKRMRYSGPEKLRPSHQMFQWSRWWEHPEVDRFNQPKPGNWYRMAMGDYQYEQRWGGVDAMRQEIKRFHEAGLTAVIYIQSYLVWKHSRLGKVHGEDWVGSFSLWQAT